MHRWGCRMCCVSSCPLSEVAAPSPYLQSTPCVLHLHIYIYVKFSTGHVLTIQYLIFVHPLACKPVFYSSSIDGGITGIWFFPCGFFAMKYQSISLCLRMLTQSFLLNYHLLSENLQKYSIIDISRTFIKLEWNLSTNSRIIVWEARQKTWLFKLCLS